MLGGTLANNIKAFQISSCKYEQDLIINNKHKPEMFHFYLHAKKLCWSPYRCFSPSIITSAILDLNENGSMSLYLIHPLILKRCKTAISYPLFLLFKIYLNNMLFFVLCFFS